MTARNLMSLYLFAVICVSGACAGTELVSAELGDALGGELNAGEQNLVQVFLKAARPRDHRAVAELFQRQRKILTGVTEHLHRDTRLRLLLLFFLRRAAPCGMTDAGLHYRVDNGRLEQEIKEIFADNTIRECVRCLDSLPPEQLQKVLEILPGVVHTSRNPYSGAACTWASDSMAHVAGKVMYAHLVAGSTAARLLVAAGKLDVPESVQARFVWSGDKPVTVRLPAPDFRGEERSSLQEIIRDGHEQYRKMAADVLRQLPEQEDAGGQSGTALLEGVMLCYGPFRENESPDAGVFPYVEAMAEDIAYLARFAKAIRTYGSTDTPGQIPLLCEKEGIDCFPGAWISRHQEANRLEVEALISICNSGLSRVKGAIAGNETLLRKDQTLSELIAWVREVRSRVKVPVTTAEIWKTWLECPELAEEVDFITVHVYGYWDGKPVAESAQYVVDIYERVKNRFPGKRVVIGETGWPSRGERLGEATPSEENQARFIAEFVALAGRKNIEAFLFEAWDEPFKKKLEGQGGVGAAWGLISSGGIPKPQIAPFLPEEVRGGIERPARIQEWTVVGQLPLVIYDDFNPQNPFKPSGWMGEIRSIQLDDACPVKPHKGKHCIRIDYRPHSRVLPSWAGIYWLAYGSWGERPGVKLQQRPRTLSFWARSIGKAKAEFKVGGVRDGSLPHCGSFGPVSTGVIALTQEWRRFTIRIPDDVDTSRLLGGICWVSNAAQNPKGCTVFMDDIGLEP